MELRFITDTKISPLHLTTMGNSAKRGDDKTLGQFDSGVKFSIAMIVRNNINFRVETISNDYKDTFTFEVETVTCEETKVVKNLIVCIRSRKYSGTETTERKKFPTSFSKEMGFNWEPWMILRELYSNAIDEKGYMVVDPKPNHHGITTMILEIEEGSVLEQPFKNINDYILLDKPELFYKDYNTEIYLNNNPDGKLRIYKQDILVHEDLEVDSRFIYNISYGTLDERRILLNVHELPSNIIRKLQACKDQKVIEYLLTQCNNVSEKDFIRENHSYGNTPSTEVNDFAAKVELENGEVKSYGWYIEGLQKRKDCKISGRKIETIEDSLWSYHNTVSVESVPEVDIKKTLIEEIEAKYDIKIEAEVKKCKLKGSKVVSDSFNNCILVSEDFSIDKDMSEFIVQYLDLKKDKYVNIIKALSDFVVEKIKK